MNLIRAIIYVFCLGLASVLYYIVPSPWKPFIVFIMAIGFHILERFFAKPVHIILHENITFEIDNESIISEKVGCDMFKKFNLFFDCDNVGSPNMIRIEVQFSNDGEKWYEYYQPFLSLYWVPNQMPIHESIGGDIRDKYFRTKILGDGISDKDNFLFSAKVTLAN